jgi:hypothetical protein
VESDGTPRVERLYRSMVGDMEWLVKDWGLHHAGPSFRTAIATLAHICLKDCSYTGH